MLLSIIIATRNRPNILHESVACLVPILVQHDWIEVLIVNDGELPLNIPIEHARITLLDNQQQGVSTARNLGAAQCQGDYLFFIDDDIWLTDIFMNWFAKAIHDLDFIGTVYNINWHYPEILKDKLKKYNVGRYLLKYNYHTMWGRLGFLNLEPNSGLIPIKGIGSGSLVIKRTVFEQQGGYHAGIKFQGEDIEFSMKLASSKIKMYAVFDTLVYHNHADRVNLNDYLHREYTGYVSEYESRGMGHIPEHLNDSYKRYVYKGLMPLEKCIIFILNKMQNAGIFTPLNLKLVGMLSGLQKYKAWKKWNPKK